MKKIILVFSLFLSTIFSYQNKTENFQNLEVSLLSDDNCVNYKEVVNITTSNNLINVSGFIISYDALNYYIVTSYKNYDVNYKYEIIFSDYLRKSATVVGYAVEDQILLLKVSRNNLNYCTSKLSKSKFIDKGERVQIVGSSNYHLSIVETAINEIGVCKNCDEETFKNYYYDLLTASIDSSLIGAGVYDKNNQLLGIITDKNDKYTYGINMLDVDKLKAICYNLINEGKYKKNHLKYNLLDVNSLTNYQKYLYSLNEDMTSGVLVSSIHYLNYFTGGLNQGMVILSVNGENISNRYELDLALSQYVDNSLIYLKVRTITNSYKTYKIKL